MVKRDKNKIDFKRIASEALANARTLLPQLLPAGRWEGHEWVCADVNGGKGNSLKVNAQSGLWKDFGAGISGGDIISLVAAIRDSNQGEAARWLDGDDSVITASPVKPKRFGHNSELPPEPAKTEEWHPIFPVPETAIPEDFSKIRHYRYGFPTKFWPYRDTNGAILNVVFRFDPPEGKQICPYTYGKLGDKGTKWYYKQIPDNRPLYGLDRLEPEGVIILTEGEKAADAAYQLLGQRQAVLTWPGGAQAINKADFTPVYGRSVVLIADADQPGRECMRRLAAMLAPHCKRVRMVLPEDVEGIKGFDAADALELGWTGKQFLSWAQERMTDYAALKLTDGDTAPPMRDEPPIEAYEQDMPVGDDSYAVTKLGVFYVKVDKGVPQYIYVCSPLYVTALTRDEYNAEWGYMLEWKDTDKHDHKWAMPASLLAANGDQYRAQLMSEGLIIEPGLGRQLTKYIQSREPNRKIRCVSKMGWYGPHYVMPGKTISHPSHDENDAVVLQSQTITHDGFTSKGTLDDYKTEILQEIMPCSRFVFAVCIALAGPTLRLLNRDCCGFHLYGSSSAGKTTALQLGASIWGGPKFMNVWRSTTNGLEGIAVKRNDCTLILDEIKQLPEKDLGEAVYGVGNGLGKIRADKYGNAIPNTSWRIMILSAGEASIDNLIKSSGKEHYAGQEMRLLNVPANANDTTGLIEHIINPQETAAFVDRLKLLVTKYYGVAGPVLVAEIVNNYQNCVERLKHHENEFLKKYLPKNAASQTQRAASKFAVVAAAGELATELGITGWPEGHAAAAVAKCFEAWQERLPAANNIEELQIIDGVRKMIEEHGSSRFEDLSGKLGGFVTRDRIGFHNHENGDVEYILTPGSYERHVCKGHSKKLVTRVLKQRQILKLESDSCPQVRRKLPGIGQTRCYAISANAVFGLGPRSTMRVISVSAVMLDKKVSETRFKELLGQTLH
jgi:putative DNA primase/helicase